MSSRVIMWSLVIVVVGIGAAVLLVPDFILVPLGDDGAEVRLIRDDHELHVFYERGSWVTRGITPYDVSIFQEYPQAGLAYITLPYVLGDDYSVYRWVLVAMNMMAYVSLIFVSLRLLKALHRPQWYAVLLVLPSMLFFSFNRFDVVVALAVQVGLWLVLSRHWRMAAVLFAAAFLIKWYPIIFLPLLYVYIRQTEGERAVHIIKRFFWIGASIAGSVLAASFLVDGLMSLRPYILHGARAGGVGSLYFMLIQGPLMSVGVEQWNYLGLAIFLLLQCSVPLYAMVQTRVISQWLTSPRQLILWMSLAALLFTLFSRFYSPQWILWFVSLLLLVADKKLVLLIIGFDVLNYLNFPLIWQVWGPHSALFNIVSLCIVALMVVMAYRNFIFILDKNDGTPINP